MIRTTEPHDEPADLPPSRSATLPADPPEAPIHNLSNGERAKIMLDAREQKKYDGMSNAKLKKILKATTLSAKHDSKKDNVIDCLYKIITEDKYLSDLAEWVFSGNPLAPKERALIVRLRGAPDPAKKLMLGEVMFAFAVNYRMDDEKLSRSNSANSRKPKNQRTVWDYEYEPNSIKTATGTLFGYFKQNAIEFASTEFRGSKYLVVFDCRVCVCTLIITLLTKQISFLTVLSNHQRAVSERIIKFTGKKCANTDRCLARRKINQTFTVTRGK
jgi:hypothetical protein